MIQVIPLGTNDKMVMPVQAITRAQAKENPRLLPKESKQVPLKKRKHKTWRERKARLVAKRLIEEEGKQQNKDKESRATSSTNNSKHEGGLFLADKIFETLYPDPKLEKRRFSICKQLIEVIQRLVEQKQIQN